MIVKNDIRKYILIILVLCSNGAWAQISSKYCLPEDSLVANLNVKKLTYTTYWTKTILGKSKIRQDNFHEYYYDDKGNDTLHLNLNEKDSSIFTESRSVFDKKNQIISDDYNLYSRFDTLRSGMRYTFEKSQSGWTLEYSKHIPFNAEKEDTSWKKKYSLLENDVIIIDSTIRQHRGITPSTLVRYYHYRQDDQIEKIKIKSYSNNTSDSCRVWWKYFEYDDQHRLTKSYYNRNGKRTIIEKHKWNDDKHELKVYSDNYRRLRRKVEYFKYDEKNRLIEYSDDLNNRILRVYYMSYYENNLLKQLVTVAPKDNWTLTQDYSYVFGE